MQLRYTERIELYKVGKTKQPNGVYLDVFVNTNDYIVVVEELVDEVAVSMYGADLNNMLRLKSIKGELEIFLKEKMSNESDNISKYVIVYNGDRYKVKAVRRNWIDIELLGKFEETLSV